MNITSLNKLSFDKYLSPNLTWIVYLGSTSLRTACPYPGITFPEARISSAYSFRSSSVGSSPNAWLQSSNHLKTSWLASPCNGPARLKILILIYLIVVYTHLIQLSMINKDLLRRYLLSEQDVLIHFLLRDHYTIISKVIKFKWTYLCKTK